MFRDFEKAPSKSSYQLKFLLAGLAVLALLLSLLSFNRVSGLLDKKNQTTIDLTSELESRDAQLELANTQLQETVAQLEAAEQKSGEAESEILALSSGGTAELDAATAELVAATARVEELDASIIAKENVIQAMGDDKSNLEGQLEGVRAELEAMTGERDALGDGIAYCRSGRGAGHSTRLCCCRFERTN